MPNYTSKFNLVKPVPTDLYDVEVFNGNMDIVDSTLANGLTYLGSEPIKGTSNDTFTSWSNIGTGYAFYGTTNRLNNQPSTYGYLVNIATLSNVAQLWFELPQGTMYYRAGNSSGLSTTWNKVITSSQFDEITLNSLSGVLPIEKGGTGKTSAGEAYKELSKRGSITNDNLLNANTLTLPGVHQVYIEDLSIVAADYNFPYRYGVIMVDGYAAYVSQTFYSLSEQKMYYRTSHNAGANWTSWTEVYDSGNKPYTASTTDLTAGTSPLPTGEVYLVYE